MFRILFLLFIVIPIIEIAVLMQVGEALGAWPTVGLVIFTAWLGAKNVRQQGLSTMQSLQNKMAVGEMPSEEIVAGFLLMIAGVLLITPGFVTDTFGFLLLVPKFRAGLIRSVQQQLASRGGQTSSFSFHQSHGFAQNTVEQPHSFSNTPSSNSNNSNIIDGEFERKD